MSAITTAFASPLLFASFFADAKKTGMTTSMAIDNAILRLSARSAYRLHAVWRAEQEAGLTGRSVNVKWSWVKAHDGLIWPVDEDCVPMSAQSAAIGTKEERRVWGRSMTY